MRKIRRALLSVSDKTGVVDLARVLAGFQCELISTGGTKAALEEAGLNVTEVSAVTGDPESFGGRMKTISFEIESALLFHREKDAAEADRLGIQPIDMVVCNLYPFGQAARGGAHLDDLVENIDIGGPTMIRAAAKNFPFVATITDVADYSGLIAELQANDGALSADTKKRLMLAAFNHTADYDALIAETMDQPLGAPSRRFAAHAGTELRYGENRHQRAWAFRQAGIPDSLCDMEVLNGKELSYNNLVDILAAAEAVAGLKRSGCAIIKHTNPCGLAEADSPLRAISRAWEGDPISAFGSVIAFNTPVDDSAARFLDLDHEKKSRRKFVEVIVAPHFSDCALDYLRLHKNLRVVKFDPAAVAAAPAARFLGGACLIQESDDVLFEKLDRVTLVKPPLDDRDLIEFGLTAVKHVKSNAIVVVRKLDDGAHLLLGMGAGQPNRLVSIRLALEKCRENLGREYDGPEEGLDSFVADHLKNALLFSDAFFPFPDNVEACAKGGIRTVFQPGGSLRDKRVIKRANELGVAMVMTGTRHFKH